MMKCLLDECVTNILYFPVYLNKVHVYLIVVYLVALSYLLPSFQHFPSFLSLMIVMGSDMLNDHVLKHQRPVLHWHLNWKKRRLVPCSNVWSRHLPGGRNQLCFGSREMEKQTDVLWLSVYTMTGTL